jgi:hypothetical protein
MTAGDWPRGAEPGGDDRAVLRQAGSGNTFVIAWADWSRTSVDDRRDADLAGWPRTDPALERAYRALLWAYPGGYRRRHGAEILTTLMEMAEPGRRWPSAADSRHLVGAGLRQRFRLPGGRPLIVVVAVLVAIIGGAFGAAAGSWAAERTFAAVPDRAALQSLHQTVTGDAGAEIGGVRDDSPWWGDLSWVSTEGPGGFGVWDVEQARQRLAADGWALGAISHPPGGASTMDEQGNTVELRMDSVSFRAERDGLVLEVDNRQTEMHGMFSTRVWTAGNATLLPFTVLGILAGLVAGWLLVAAGTQRLRHADPARPGPRGLIIGGTVLTVAALALPAVAFYGNVMRAFRYAGDEGMVFTVHSALTPGGYWPFGPQWLNAALTGAGLILAVAVLAMTRRVSAQPAVTSENRATT